MKTSSTKQISSVYPNSGSAPNADERSPSFGISAKYSVEDGAPRDLLACTALSDTTRLEERRAERLDRLRAEQASAVLKESRESLEASGVVRGVVDLCAIAISFERTREIRELYSSLDSKEDKGAAIYCLLNILPSDHQLWLHSITKEKFDTVTEEGRAAGFTFLEEEVMKYYSNQRNKIDWLNYHMTLKKEKEKQSSVAPNKSSCILF